MSRPVSLLVRFTTVVVIGVAAFAVIGGLLIPGVFALRHSASFEPSMRIALPELVEGSQVLDRHGQPMGELVGAENRTVVPLEEISDEMIQTVLTVEDADFYRHRGVNGRSVLRAFRANSAAGEISQGGSTITQQLVKLSLVGSERTFGRKLKEASLAIQLENQFCDDEDRTECKDRILEQYLNLVYLGRGAYGVEAAAQLYFGMHASELGWNEAALLTSLIRNPNGADPISDPEFASTRRGIVLRRLAEEGLLTDDQAGLLSFAPMPTGVHRSARTVTAEDLDYFERRIRDELLDAEWLAPTEELRRHLIFNGGLTITSTFDPRAQELADAAAAENPLAARNPETVAVVAAVEPANGAVRAVVGETVVPGRGPVEVASPAVGRSPGSAFKTFTLVAALEEGHSLRDSISASPAPRRLYDDWGIEASTWPSGCRGGTVDLQRATASSNNCAFARLQAAIGADKVVDVARRLGIDTVGPEDEVASLSLGGTQVRPLEMAAAYAAIANDGRYNAPYFVEKVEDRDGNVLYRHETTAEQAIPVEVARQATVALHGVVTGGTYGAGSLPGGREAAGKTGTNESADGGNTDVWFVGFTPQLATAVWIGNPASTTEMRGASVHGGTTAARVWRAFMAPYHQDLPEIDFERPARTAYGRYIKDPWGQYSSSSSSSSSRRSGSQRYRTTTTVDADDSSGGGVETPTTAGPASGGGVPTTSGPPSGGGGDSEPGGSGDEGGDGG